MTVRYCFRSLPNIFIFGTQIDKLRIPILNSYSTFPINLLAETLRKYPVVAFLLRQCMKDYPIPGTNKIIQKGVDINIPILGLQRDERYYPEPDEFIPERFNAENSVGKNLLTRPYYPFGDGPRNCIGMRLGKMQTKVGLLLMLKQFSFELDPDEIKKGLEFHPSVNVLAPKETIYYKVKKRST